MFSLDAIKVADLEPAELANRIEEIRNELALTFNPANVSDDAVRLLAEFRALVETAISKGVLQFRGV